jgi:hypothetical protein
MSASRFLFSGALLVALTGSVRAEPPLPLDLIPDRACIGIAARDLADLKTKSDRLLGNMPNRPLERPSQLLDMALKELRLTWEPNEKKPVALVCMTGALGGFDENANPDQNFTIGAVLAPQKLDDAAKAYKLDVATLMKGQAQKVPGREGDRNFGTNWVGYRDGEIYMTGSEKGTEAWLKAPRVRQGQTPARQKRLDAADGLLYFGPPLLELGQKDFNPETSVDSSFGPQEVDAQRRINRALLEARYVLAGYSVTDGFGVDLSVGFDPKGTHSQALLKSVTGTNRSSNLTGLPDSERLVGAISAIGLERTDLHLARVMASDLWLGLRQNTPILGSNNEMVRRLFGDFYSKLKLGKVALYQSSDRAKYGQFAAVVILEPTNPGQFLNEIAQYAKFGDVDQFDPKGEASKAEIEKLVADLGSDDFDVRESAGTKLGLIGVPALPYLEKAEKSDDAEVRRRAADLQKSIKTVADLRKKELADGLVKKAFKPTFTLQLNAEKQADTNVHVLGLKLEGEDAPYAAALKDLFGPDWRRVRIAVINKQAVLLIGSELPLLEQAIQNVRDGKPGLEQSAALADFHKQAAPERRIELHLALSRARALLTPADQLPKDYKPIAAVSSVSVRTGTTDAGLDLWVPAAAVQDFLTWQR